RNGGATASGLSLTLSMEWHCAQWVRTNVRPRCAAGDWARTGLLADARNAPTAIIIQRCLAGYVGATLVCPLLHATSKPGDPPERFSRHLVDLAFGQGRQPKRRASSRWDNIFAKQDRKVSLRARARIVVCFHRPYTPAEDLA